MEPIIYEEARSRMARTARTMGIVAVIIIIAIPTLAILGLMLGAFAVLLAFLSTDKKHGVEKIALTTGAIAIVASITLFTTATLKFVNDTAFRHAKFDEIASVYQEFYGPEYAEFVIELKDYCDEKIGVK